MRHGLSRTFLLAGSLLSLLAAGCASHPLATTAPKPIVLTASTARIVGNNARVDVIPQVEYIGYWTNEDTFVEWPLKRLQPGTYRVHTLYSLDPRYPLSTIALSTGGHTLTARPASTRNWDDYRVLYMGTIKIPASSDTTVTVKVLEKPMNYVMNLQGVILTPEEN